MDYNSNRAGKTAHNHMIYNENLSAAYGEFREISNASAFVKYRPIPTQEDYSRGYLVRFFAKKVNENNIIEIDAGSTNRLLYKVVQVQWKITGPKNNIYKDGILDKAGVIDQNKFEIDRLKKEQDIDLREVLKNPLEYWRGN
jgi:hypothetical protein